MSHFTVLLIGDLESIDKQLAPYHEFECTGQDDKYIVDVDETINAREKYEAETRTMLWNKVSGEMVDRYDDRFYRPATPEETKILTNFSTCHQIKNSYSKDGVYFVREVPAGWEDITVKTSEVLSFLEFVDEEYQYTHLHPGEEKTDDHKYGFVELNNNSEVVRVINRTNPNAKWDWYVVGGRWEQFFPLKGTSQRVPSALKRDIDFEDARDRAEQDARDTFKKWSECLKNAAPQGRPQSWGSFYKQVETGDIDLDEARKRYRNQPAIKAWKELDVSWDCPVENIGFDEEKYAQRRRDAALSTFAVIKDGKWYAKGKMGWWAAVSDAMDQDEWYSQVRKVFEEASPDTRFTIVDCHI